MALKLKGSTSGFVAIDCAAEGGNNTLILPSDNGVAGAIWANNVDTAGVATCTSITINKNGDLTVPGTVSVGGTLTYEDVTNVDAVGVVTAAQGVRINGGGLSVIGVTTGLNVAGVGTFTNGLNITGNITNGLNVSAGIATFAGNVNTGPVLTATGTEGVSASLYLIADEGDDNGDGWRFNSNQDDNDLTISNNTTGSYVDKFTLLKTGELTLTSDLTIPDKIIHSGDTNTAIRFPAADTFTVETAGSERVRIDSTGNFGVGTNNPAYKTQVSVSNTTAYSGSTIDANQFQLTIANAGAAGVAGILLATEPSSGNGGHCGIRALSTGNGDSALTFSTRASATSGERVRITAGGKVLVGGTSAVGNGTNLEVLHSSLSSVARVLAHGFIARDNYGTATNIGNGIYSPASNVLAFATNSTERFRIASDGSMGLGTTPETDGQANSLYFANGNANIWGSGNVNLYSVVNARYTGTAWKYNNTAVASYVGQQSGVWSFHNAPSGTADAAATFTERVRITTDGYLGIGAGGNTNKPLHIYRTTDDAEIRLQTNSGTEQNSYIALRQATGDLDFYTVAASTKMKFYTVNSERMRIDHNGNMGLGYGSPSQRLVVHAGSDNSDIAVLTGGDVARGLKISTSANTNNDAFVNFDAQTSSYGGFIFKTQGTERMRMIQDGRLFIGVTSPIDGNCQIAMHGQWGASGCGVELKNTGNPAANRDFIRFYNKDDGEAGAIEHNAATSVQYLTSSDYRLKENVVDITDGIERLKLLKPRKFSWIDDPELGLRDGFIAHEVSPVIPHCVSGEKDAVKEDGSIQTQTMEYSQLTPLLTAALQEAIAKIETLETKVAALEGS